MSNSQSKTTDYVLIALLIFNAVMNVTILWNSYGVQHGL